MSSSIHQSASTKPNFKPFLDLIADASICVFMCVEGGVLMPRGGAASFLLRKCAQWTK